MQMMSNEYENIFNFLKEALNFYGNEENYIKNINKDNLLVSKIELDSGHQARFAIKQIDVIKETNNEMEEDMLKNFPKEMENTDIHDEFLNLIDKLKKIE